MIRANSKLGMRFLALAALALSAVAASTASAFAATPAWKTVGVAGPTHLPPRQSETQRLAVDASGGTFTLTFSGQTTAPIAFDAPASGVGSVQAALENLSNLEPGDVLVSGGPGGGGMDSPYFVAFGGGLADTNVPELAPNGGALTGDGSQTAMVATTVPGGVGTGDIVVHVANIGGALPAGTITLSIGPLPDGIVTTATPDDEGSPGWICSTGAGQTLITCTYLVGPANPPMAPGTQALPVLVPISIDSSAAPSSTMPIRVEGGGASTDEYTMPVTVSPQPATAGTQILWAGAFDENGEASTQAGGHPARASAFFRLNTVRNAAGVIAAAGDPRDIEVDVPPGFVGNPLVTERCPTEVPVCGPADEAGGHPAAVGTVEPFINRFIGAGQKPPLYNNVPRFGYPAQFSFHYFVPDLTLVGDLRSDEDYGVTVISSNTPVPFKLFGSLATLDGNPAGADGDAFLTNPTGCSPDAQGTPVTTFAHNTWQAPSVIDSKSVELPKVEGCEQLEFGTPDVPVNFTFQPSTSQAASTTAATAHLHIDQEGLLDPDQLATPHLKRSVVTLPKGLVLNPAAADGLETCTTEQIGLMGTGFPMPNPIRFDKSSPRCPDASKVGTAEIDTPLLEDPVAGVVYLAAQDDNPFDALVAIYLVVDDARTGTVIKLPGEVRRDPQDGQLTAVFDHNPQLPFENLTLRIRGGDRSSLATPDTCGTHTTSGEWTPWSAPESGPPATTSDSFGTTSGPNGAPCAATKAQRPFDLGLSAGTNVPVAGEHAPFSLRLTRPDGNQELDRISVTIPQGLVATPKGVPSCSEAAIAAAAGREGKAEMANPSCPAASQLGTTTVGAGVGPTPIYVRTGKVYLSGPYDGAPLSLAVVVPAVAGPFDLGVQVVRTALRIDPKTAKITAVSDPLPKILEGIPLQVRDIRIDIDRPNFTLNPTSCEQMAVAARVDGASGAVANLTDRFQVGGCEKLGFKPRISLTLAGGTRRGDNPALKAVVRPRPGDANIARAAVTLPRSAFLDQDHIRTVCTRVQFAADACPNAAIYGRATAVTPLLDDPLTGPVYLRSSDNLLPDLVADLRGPAHQPIKIEAAFRTDSIRGGLRSTLDFAPDAPVTKFTLQMQGGKKGLVVNSQNLCANTNRALARLKAHNGRRFDSRPKVVALNCKKQRRGKGKSRAR